jgi:hypothetical protein
MHVEIWLGCKSVGHGDSGTMIWWGRETDVEGEFLSLTESMFCE